MLYRLTLLSRKGVSRTGDFPSKETDLPTFMRVVAQCIEDMGAKKEPIAQIQITLFKD